MPFKFFTSLLLSVSLFFQAMAQPAHDTPCGAINLAVTDGADPPPEQRITFTNATYTPYVINGITCTRRYTNNPDVWYKFTATKTTAKIDVGPSQGIITCGSFWSYDEVEFLILTGSCSGPFTYVSCGRSDQDNVLLKNLVPGTTYYIKLSTISATANVCGDLSCVVYSGEPPAGSNVGIHTRLPKSNLDIAGSVLFRNNIVFQQSLTLNDYLNLKNNQGTNIGLMGVQDGQNIGLYTVQNGWSLIINPNGNVGIGTASASKKLEVVSGPSATPTTLVIGNRGGFGPTALEFVSDYGSGSQWRPGYIQSGDIGNFTGKLEFFTNGSGSNNLYGNVKGMEIRNGSVLTATGSVGSFSDERLKQQVAPFTDGLNVINQINPVLFQYNANAPFTTTQQQIGIIAQELEKIAPYMVRQTAEGEIKDMRWVDHQAYIFLLINAVKEQQQLIEAMQKKIDQLSKK